MLSQSDFRRLAQFIQGYCGIRLPDSKRTMLEGRLRRRLVALHMSDYRQYCRYVFDENGLGDEVIHLIDAVTTNKTDFFREPEHFRFLAEVVVPRLLETKRTPRLTLWSAASSIGAEAYTLCMVLEDMIRAGFRFDYTVLATDISTQVLERAARGIFSTDMARQVPSVFRGRYLMQARDPGRPEMRVIPELRAKVQFMRMNLLEDAYPLSQPSDVVFCRNILIYFDKPTQEKVLDRLCAAMPPGGYLFLGHSETIAGLALPLEQVATTVFVRV
ncbi:MAG TPA: CheR family methyltransferase [Magnetospirillum sp.]|jgi:chemotaxis protein methyltransferase CheR|nr:CheR family methyltransferase [Magnetospirillum sp.]